MRPIPFRATLIGELELPRITSSPGAARDAVDTWLGADHPAGFDVRLVVSELVTNAVRHSDLPAAHGVHLKLYDLGGLIRVEVRDPGAVRTTPKAETAGDDWTREGGRGLFIVEQCSTRWGVDYRPSPHGCLVWCEILSGTGERFVGDDHRGTT